MNHKPTLEVKHMLNMDINMESTLREFYAIMKICKIELKNRATFQNLTDLTPVIANETRSTAKYDMLQRFNTICEKLLPVADTESTKLDIDASPQFRRQALRVEKQLAQTNLVTQKLQKKNLSLAECRISIESLLECVENGRDELGNPFYRSKFQGLYVSANVKLSSDENFESGVVKILRGLPDLMTEIEKRACRALLVQPAI